MTPSPSSIDLARGQRIRALREQRGWPRRELAERAGVSLRSVENYEAGRPARVKAFAALADALGVTEHFLRTGEQAIEERIDANSERLERVEARLAELEYTMAQAALASRRIWVSVDSVLRLVLTHLADEGVLALLPDPPTAEAPDGKGYEEGTITNVSRPPTRAKKRGARLGQPDGNSLRPERVRAKSGR